jgi:hypothetical protein
LFDGLALCGIAVCDICSANFGSDGSFKCAEHAPTVYERLTTEACDSADNRKVSSPSNRVMEKENCPPNNQKSSSGTWIQKSQAIIDSTQSAKGMMRKRKLQGSMDWSVQQLRYFFSVELGSQHLRRH